MRMRTSWMVVIAVGAGFGCYETSGGDDGGDGGSSGSVAGQAGSGGSGGASAGNAGANASGRGGTSQSGGSAGSAGTAAGGSGTGGVSGAMSTAGEGGADTGSDGGAVSAGEGGVAVTAGTAGAAGATDGESGAAGAAGEPGVECPIELAGDPLPDGTTLTRVEGVPLLDDFNGDGANIGGLDGVAWIGGSVYVSELAPGANKPASRVLRLDSDGSVHAELLGTGAAGLAVDRGMLVAGNRINGTANRYTLPAGALDPVMSTYQGYPFNAPQDFAVHSNGTIFFTDPDRLNPSAPQTITVPQSSGQTHTRVYRVPFNNNVALVADAMLTDPSGVALSPDETSLYVSYPDGIVRSPVTPEGIADTGSRQPFGEGIVDGRGMSVDCAGNVYVATQNRVIVLSPDGTTIDSLTFETGVQVTNVGFGGADLKTLYATTAAGESSALYRAAVPVPGNTPY
jgi:gluconolactonase